MTKSGFSDVSQLKILRCGYCPGSSGWVINAITCILVWEKQREILPQTEEEKAVWPQRQRLDQYSLKLRNACCHQKQKMARDRPSPEPHEEVQPWFGPWYWFPTSGLQNYQGIHLCCFEPQMCGDLLQWPQEANTMCKSCVQISQEVKTSQLIDAAILSMRKESVHPSSQGAGFLTNLSQDT